ncbi:phage GP46 family protein [Aliivibrio sp. S4TY2]|uniref:phage GP46 family protein n=1 Tax=unclassified Aliivibrio TaxID=2645654 RepID=UPI002377DA88|nr:MULTISPECIES: phage GP46 family protein [unclassified Aliivibrio]MDD9158516.1 phage GP46 family protein [Aliivibrio sp. S4TY2]MDD9162516.1 phage GP46 family protein [Aliivibrio sp. S4TY1]MDD9166515.1 phage GP46 family protein [Aliivibrio sp. S4MY2]MDD9170512.1 phage GP46 family protein [Aliivibrio sp. S4MY4]MDD9187591.1 phage GP46 family protein [Aliivibrio sp. S4MY3]
MSHFNLTALTAPLTSIDGLTHAALQSVLNHSTSTQNDRARMKNDERGGCWNEDYVRAIGSRDWTLAREKNTPQTLIRTQRFYDDALAWLVDEGHARSVQVNAVALTSTTIGREIIITTNDNELVKVPL